KRVMEEHRAKATMVFHRPRSGGSMEKIVPKGDFFHRFRALRSGGKSKPECLAKVQKFLICTKVCFSTSARLTQNPCWR
ncbi:hypothetical protein, partial [Flavobacterium psychrophilum]|uniref:hypothetical protein n=1 Tax=Flavobacterium psychrophilum TaxID=96345 RepID=UPI001D07A382